MEAKDLNLSFGTEAIYNDANFKFELGDKVGIVGVNGAGKTTLFKVILGAQSLDSGEIKFVSPTARLGHIPQEITIPDSAADQTVWDYIAAARPFDELQEKLNLESAA